MKPDRLLTRTLRNSPHRAHLTRILAAALDAVEPGAAVTRHLRRDGNTLLIDRQRYPLAPGARVYLVGAGKAGYPMAQTAVQILGETLTAGIIIVKEGHADSAILGPVTVVEAGHPLPDNRGLAGTRQINSLLSQTKPGDLVLCLLSGGGSALLTQPAPGISLDDLQTLTGQLLACGASIYEINTLRKHLSQIKGGQLARHAAPARLAALILSDVVGDLLNVIASGPTVPDPTTFYDAQQTLVRYDLLERAPPAIRQRLARGDAGEIPDTPKADDPAFARVRNVIVGSNRQAAEAAFRAARKAKLRAARQTNLRAHLLTTEMEGEAREKGRWLGSILRRMALTGHPAPRPACLIAGGETTVTLRGPGRGGRNQELALAAVRELAGLPDVFLITLATDGGDGPTDAAGAVVTGETLARAQALGLNPDDFLARNDSYAFFDALGDLLRPGPTQTNVNDLTFLFAL